MASHSTIERIELRQYDLPLFKPMRVGGVDLRRRAGLLLLFHDQEGRCGIGETAPLPGLHAETLEEARHQLLRLVKDLRGSPIPEDCPALNGALASWLDPRELSPSVRVGIEGAVLSLLSEVRGISLSRLLAPHAAEKIGVNGLLEGDAEAVLRAAAHYGGEGYASLKIKVGRGDPNEEARLVTTVRRVVGERVSLRLDANQAWDFDTALNFAKQVAPARIEYIEEPLRAGDDLSRFIQSSGLPAALDESLRTRSFASPESLPEVAALILKPAVLGGFERAMAWVRCARKRRILPVISAVFPSAVGLSLEAAFAAAVAPETTHGLGTFAFFAQDLSRLPLAARGGKFDLARLPRRPGDFLWERTHVVG